MKRHSRELSSQMAAKILEHERTEDFLFKNLTVRNKTPLPLILIKMKRVLPPD